MTIVQAPPSPAQSVWQKTVDLPVGYLNGNGNSPLHRRATVRKLTGREEALMADPQLKNNSGNLITALLSNCVTLEGLDQVNGEVARQLCSADRNFLLLQLRRLTFGDEMDAKYRCPYCQKETLLREDLSTLNIQTIEDGDLPEVRVTLKDGYQDLNGNWHYEFVFRLPTGEDEEVAAGRRDDNPVRQSDALLARCLKQVGDLEQRRINALGVRILSDLSMGDRHFIQKALDEATPGPDLTRNVVCHHCGEAYQTPLDMSHFFSLA